MQFFLIFFLIAKSNNFNEIIIRRLAKNSLKSIYIKATYTQKKDFLQKTGYNYVENTSFMHKSSVLRIITQVEKLEKKSPIFLQKLS